MNKHSIVLGLLILLTACTSAPLAPEALNQVSLNHNTAGDLQGSYWPVSLISLSGDSPELSVSVKAASGNTFLFKTQNGLTFQDTLPQAIEIPDLVLYRNGTLSQDAERSLEVQVSGLRLPPGITQVAILLETQHVDPDQPGAQAARITAWSDSVTVTNNSETTQVGDPLRFEHLFNATIPAGDASIPTPTDYYRLEIQVNDPGNPIDPPRVVYSQEYAFVLENVWSVALPNTLETSPGAAPTSLMVFACDMFVPPVDPRAAVRVSRAQFPGFIQDELIPQMVAAYRILSEDWGFSWHAEWTGYRPEVEQKTLSVALTNGTDWFHGAAPALGNALISINLVNPYIYDYFTLLDGAMTIFHHELFHNLQRSINLHAGGKGEVNGLQGAWAYFAEGMAVVAESAAHPSLAPHNATAWDYFYPSKANVFIREDLNRSYRELSDYNSAIYWHFLYEKCGGFENGSEHPEAGMYILRRILETLYSQEIVDIDTSDDLIGYLPLVMDHALSGSACPFQDYSASLVSFTRAIYALKLQGGRCGEAGYSAECGLADLQKFYDSPDATFLHYVESSLAYACADLSPAEGSGLGCSAGTPGDRPVIAGFNQDPQTEEAGSPAAAFIAITSHSQGIPSSFGMDFVEIILEPGSNGQPLSVEFQGESGSPARFHVNFLLLSEGGAVQQPAAGIESAAAPDGKTRFTIPALDLSAYNRIALLITRLDAQEDLDYAGKYSISVTP